MDPLPTIPLYHYTSLEGLIGIVSTKTLRATHIAHLNDANELTHAVDLLEGVAQRRLMDEELDSEERKCLSQLIEWLSHRMNLDHLLFTCSLTEAGNLLSQWRAYCPPSAGVSIGFAPDALLAAADAQGFQLVKCIYDRPQQTSLVEEWLDRVLATKGDLDTLAEPAAPSQTYHPHFRRHEEQFLQIAARMKHSGFSEEREWRLVSSVGRDLRDPKLKFRAGKTRLIPYVEFVPPTTDSGSLSLRHVYIGPAQDHNISFGAIAAFLTNSRVKVSDGIRACGIPLRNW